MVALHNFNGAKQVKFQLPNLCRIFDGRPAPKVGELQPFARSKQPVAWRT
jgi:hypothetical protein